MANNTKGEVVIEVGGGRNGLGKSDIIGKAAVRSSGKKAAMIGRP